MVLPDPVANAEWAQSGGNASKSMGHVALGANMSRIFSQQVGAGGSLSERLGSPPVVADGRVFIAGFDRPNIRYHVTPKKTPRSQLLAFLGEQERTLQGRELFADERREVVVDHR